MKPLPPVLVSHPHVEVRPDVFSGSPVIVGTRVPVRRLWSWHSKGVSVETLVKRYPSLRWAQILDALSFAHDNKDLVEADLARERALLEATVTEEKKCPRAHMVGGTCPECGWDYDRDVKKGKKTPLAEAVRKAQAAYEPLTEAAVENALRRASYERRTASPPAGANPSWFERRPSEMPIEDPPKEGPSPEALKRKAEFADAVNDEIAKHHAEGRSIAVWRDGKVVELPPPEAKKTVDQIDAADGRLRILRDAFDKAPPEVRESAWWKDTVANALRMTPPPVLDETVPPGVPMDLHQALRDWCFRGGIPVSMRNDLARALRLDEIQDLRDRTARGPGLPTFEEAWKEKEAAGYQYGHDALEQVRFGWEIRDGYDTEYVRTLRESLSLAYRDNMRSLTEERILVKNICDRILERIEGSESVVEEIVKDFANGVALPDCIVVPASSRACEIGTKGCEVQHDKGKTEYLFDVVLYARPADKQSKMVRHLRLKAKTRYNAVEDVWSVLQRLGTLEVPREPGEDEHTCGESGEVGAAAFLACKRCQAEFSKHTDFMTKPCEACGTNVRARIDPEFKDAWLCYSCYCVREGKDPKNELNTLVEMMKTGYLVEAVPAVPNCGSSPLGHDPTNSGNGCEGCDALHAELVEKHLGPAPAPNPQVDYGRMCPECDATLVNRSGVVIQGVLSVAKKLVKSWNSEAERMPTRRNALVQELRAAMQRARLF